MYYFQTDRPRVIETMDKRVYYILNSGVHMPLGYSLLLPESYFQGDLKVVK